MIFVLGQHSSHIGEHFALYWWLLFFI